MVEIFQDKGKKTNLLLFSNFFTRFLENKYFLFQ